MALRAEGGPVLVLGLPRSWDTAAGMKTNRHLMICPAMHCSRAMHAPPAFLSIVFVIILVIDTLVYVSYAANDRRIGISWNVPTDKLGRGGSNLLISAVHSLEQIRFTIQSSASS